MELIVDATSPTLWLWQALALDYSGRVNSRSWWAGGAMRTETFAHDELNRLTGISGASNKSFTYHLEGNLLTKDGNTYAYPAPGGVRPHGVSSIAGTINGVANPGYQYDGNGNLTAECPSGNCTSPARTLAWTSDNYPSAISKGSTSLSFWYDADRARAAQMATVIGVLLSVLPGDARAVGAVGATDPPPDGALQLMEPSSSTRVPWREHVVHGQYLHLRLCLDARLLHRGHQPGLDERLKVFGALP